MAKVILYVKNVSIALWRMVRAPLGLYTYHPDDGYVKNVLVILDCLGNSLAGGDPDETISSRAAKARDAGQEWGCLLCKFLNWFQTNHCTLALERNKGHRAVIPDAGD
jgi:hypothetical protein